MSIYQVFLDCLKSISKNKISNWEAEKIITPFFGMVATIDIDSNAGHPLMSLAKLTNDNDAIKRMDLNYSNILSSYIKYCDKNKIKINKYEYIQLIKYLSSRLDENDKDTTEIFIETLDKLKKESKEIIDGFFKNEKNKNAIISEIFYAERLPLKILTKVLKYHINMESSFVFFMDLNCESIPENIKEIVLEIINDEFHKDCFKKVVDNYSEKKETAIKAKKIIKEIMIKNDYENLNEKMKNSEEKDKSNKINKV